jgi:arylsulfatase A-like enzyme
MKTTASLGAIALAQQAFPAIGNPRRRSDKPNLLFLWTDQQRPDTFAAYGNRRVHAPHLDRLASESTVFTRSYVTQPVCTPSRSSVLSGLWPSQNGCLMNDIPLAAGTACQPELLGDPDYRTGFMGKWHLGNEIWSQHGFEEWQAIEDHYNDHFSQGKDQTQRSAYHHFLIENGLEPDVTGAKGPKFSRGFASRLPLEFSKPTFLRDRARDFIRRHRDEPFLLHVNFLEPHHPNTGPLNGLHPIDDMDLPPSWNVYPDASVPARYHYCRLLSAIERGITEEDIRRETSRYWGLVTQIDIAVGGILRELDKWGLRENTIVVFTSDHGEMMGSHGIYGKNVMYEESARVPCLIQFPKKGFGAARIERPVSHIDLVPTVLDLLGVSERAEGLPGKSLARHLNRSHPPQPVFQQWHPLRSLAESVIKAGVGGSADDIRRAFGDVRTRAVITPDGYKLALSDNDVPEFYDLNRDPYEMTNAYSQSGSRQRIAAMTKLIEAWQASIGDTVTVKGKAG